MKFSVIIPAYKPFFLKECIDSILGQTYSNLEIIIVNDASPYNKTAEYIIIKMRIITAQKKWLIIGIGV